MSNGNHWQAGINRALADMASRHNTLADKLERRARVRDAAASALTAIAVAALDRVAPEAGRLLERFTDEETARELVERALGEIRDAIDSGELKPWS